MKLRLLGLCAITLGVSGAACEAAPEIAPGAASARPAVLEVSKQRTGQRRIFRAVAPDRLGLASGQLDDLCGRDQLSFSRDGRKLALWNAATRGRLGRPGSDLVVLDVQCVEAGLRDACLMRGFALDGVAVLGWSGPAPDRLVLRVGTDDLTVLDLKAGLDAPRIMEEVEGRRPELAGVRSVGPLSTLDGKAELSLRRAEILKALAATPAGHTFDRVYLRDGVAFASTFERDSDLSLLVISQGNATPTDLRFPALTDLNITPKSDGSVLLTAKGMFGTPKFHISDAPYSSTVFDSATGAAAGTFKLAGPQRGAVGDGEPPRIGAQFIDGVAIVAGATAASGGDMAGGRVFSLKTTRGQISHACPAPETSLASTASIEMLDLGDDRRPLPALKFTPTVKPAGLVVYFHGGPGGAIALGPGGAAIRRYLDLGWEVLAIDYSSSSGVGDNVARRLRSEGLRAIETDASHVARLVDKQDGPVVIHAESFGALPAAALEQRLRRPAAGLFLAAPFLRYRDPAVWAARSPLGAIDPNYQRRFEMSYGLDKRDLHASSGRAEFIEDWSPRAPATIVFAEKDVVSAPSDVPPMLRSRALVEVSPGVHETIAVDDRLWSIVSSRLSEIRHSQPVS